MSRSAYLVVIKGERENEETVVIVRARQGKADLVVSCQPSARICCREFPSQARP